MSFCLCLSGCDASQMFTSSSENNATIDTPVPLNQVPYYTELEHSKFYVFEVEAEDVTYCKKANDCMLVGGSCGDFAINKNEQKKASRYLTLHYASIGCAVTSDGNNPFTGYTLSCKNNTCEYAYY